MQQAQKTQIVRTVSVSIQNLTKSYTLRRHFQKLDNSPFAAIKDEYVLRGVNLEVYEGEVLGLLGQNGAGKTTLIEILSTLLLPTAGQAFVSGHNVVRQASQVRRVISYCAAASENFYPRISARRNLEFFALLNDLSPRVARERIEVALEQVGLSLKGDVPYQRYSDGMKQELALARALLTNPAVMLLDEPTRSLDPLLQAGIRKLLRRLLVEQLGKTVLLVTHSLAEAEQVCDRVAILHRGQIVKVGTLDEVKRSLGGTDLANAFERAVTGGECQ